MRNAKDTPISDLAGAVPQVQGALLNWFHKIKLIRIEKRVIDFKEVENETILNIKGLLQPMQVQEIKMKPHGQRAWRWHTIYTEVGNNFNVEDVIVFKGTRFRVLNKINFSSYGYLKYDLVEDYETVI